MKSVLALTILLPLGLGACSTQRVPGPMGRPEGLILPIGQGGDYVPGPEEVIIVRHGDPVSIRRPGSTAGFPLSFHNKRMRLGSGGWVLSGSGGRAEVLWPGSGSEVQLFDTSSVMVGETSRAEPILSMSHCIGARIELAPGHRIALVGGAELVGDETLDSGPFDFSTVAPDRIAIGNNGSTMASILFFDYVLDLGPGEVIELPILPRSASPIPEPYGSVDLAVSAAFPGPIPRAQGAVARLPLEGRLALRAEESARVSALGVTIDLKPGEEVIFSPTGSRP